jgi:hypothetical protein
MQPVIRGRNKSLHQKLAGDNGQEPGNPEVVHRRSLPPDGQRKRSDIVFLLLLALVLALDTWLFATVIKEDEPTKTEHVQKP